MSDPEGFMTRWSRRKREAEQAASDKPATADATEAPAAPPESAAPAEAEQPDAPAVDLDALPSIESITAGTDIRAFLAPGIPAHLTRAALRRAWETDPAIRDFVGLAENAWDFNAPGGVPGFGPTLPVEEAQRLVAEILGDHKAPPAVTAEGETEPLGKPDVSAPPKVQPVAGVTGEAPVADRTAPAVAGDEPHDVAVQDEKSGDQPVKAAQRHGGAMPR